MKFILWISLVSKTGASQTYITSGFVVINDPNAEAGINRIAENNRMGIILSFNTKSEKSV